MTKQLIQVVDFFSGCGGMSYGFANAKSRRVRFEIRGALDLDPHANATFEKMLGVKPKACDISRLNPSTFSRASVPEWSLATHLPLVVIGCAPCQGFSSHRKKDSRVDGRNSLLRQFGRLAIALKPDVIVMENVPEMWQTGHWEHFAHWRQTLRRAGYTVRARIFNLAEFGVPQERFRAVAIASRNWTHFRMPRSTHMPHTFVSVRDAIGHLPILAAGGRDAHDPMHITSRHRLDTVELIRMIPVDGGSRRSLPNGIGPRCWKGVDGFRDVYGRLFWDKPSVAITARCRTPSCGRFVHPAQHRGLSVREAAFLQGFPANYVFEGPFDDKYKQIGNAVSPIFAKKIAEHIGNEWFMKHDHLPDDMVGDVDEPITKSFSSSIAAIKRRRDNMLRPSVLSTN